MSGYDLYYGIHISSDDILFESGISKLIDSFSKSESNDIILVPANYDGYYILSTHSAGIKMNQRFIMFKIFTEEWEIDCQNTYKPILLEKLKQFLLPSSKYLIDDNMNVFLLNLSQYDFK